MTFNFANQELRTELLFEDNKTKVELQMLNNSSGAFNIDLIAKDITTNLFVALFPETLESIKSNLKASIKSNWIDDLIFSISYGHDEASLNYMNGSINTNEFLYQIDSDQLVKAKTVDLNLKDNHIAISLNNGFYNNTPFNNAKVLINTSSEELFYKSQHIFINSDFETENLTEEEYNKKLKENGIKPFPIKMINPKIVSLGDKIKEREEGCLSIPGYNANVKRPASLIVEYTDENKKIVTLNTDGLLATCIQHEMDHLEGILFIDYLSKLKKSMIIKKLSKNKSPRIVV